MNKRKIGNNQNKNRKKRENNEGNIQKKKEEIMKKHVNVIYSVTWLN